MTDSDEADYDMERYMAVHYMEGQCIGRGWRRIVPRAWQIPQSDKTVAGFKAREITGVFAVENELVISKN